MNADTTEHFECDACPVAEARWCMKAGHCEHRDGPVGAHLGNGRSALDATPEENESCPTTARTAGTPCASVVVTTAQEAVRSAFITGISGESFQVSLKYRTLAGMQSAHSALVAFAAFDATPEEGEIGWRSDIENAPRDGTDILAWCVHPNAQYDTATADKSDWQGPVIARWIEFNGGGWTWHGHVGTFTHWRALPAAPLSGSVVK